MKEARKYAQGDEQKIAVNMGFMRLYIMGKENVDKNWLKLVEEEFDKAILIDRAVSEPYFHMGLAYKMSYKFRQAADQFSIVLELDKGYIAEADKEYDFVQKIERAMPCSKIGKKIALVEKITRANDLPYFNAVMICTTRGIMVAKDLVTGEFDPTGPVSGADALLSIRILKSQISIPSIGPAVDD